MDSGEECMKVTRETKRTVGGVGVVQMRHDGGTDLSGNNGELPKWAGLGFFNLFWEVEPRGSMIG